MAITVLFFGQLAELSGTRSLSVSDVEDTRQVRERLFEQFPALKNVVFNMAVNTDIVQENTVLAPGNVVALLPPFSGG